MSTVDNNPATKTAIGPMVIVALEQHEPKPLVHDDLAARLLPGSVAPMLALARLGPVRRAIHTMSDKQIPGIWGEMLCRKRYVDDALTDAVEAGATAIVILGAGMDTRAYRQPEAASGRVFEVDLPANIERKRAGLRRVFGKIPEHVTLVPVDLGREDLAAALKAAGWASDMCTLFVWEAVTQYLTEDGVRRTLDVMARAAAGSRLVFTYVRQDFLSGTAMYGAEAAYKQFVTKGPLWKFGLEPDAVAGFLAEYGWRQVEQVGTAEYQERYVEPSGRQLPVSEIERAVLAEKEQR